MAWRIAALGEDAGTNRRLVAYSEDKGSWACIEAGDDPGDRIEFQVENLAAISIGLNFQASHDGSFFAVAKEPDSSVLVSFRLANETQVSKERMSLQEFEKRLNVLTSGRPAPRGGPWLGP